MSKRAVIEAYAGRWGTKTLAKKLNMSERTVWNYYSRYHCSPRNRGGWYTTGQAARVTGLSMQWLSRLCREGKVRARRLPGSGWWQIHPEDVERLVARYNPVLWRRWLER